MKKTRIGLLTGGGDAPGLNGVIESTVRALRLQNIEVIGIRDGFEGIFNRQTIELTETNVIGAHSHAGTLIGTSNKSSTAGRVEEFLSCYKSLNLDGLVACGGDGTFASLERVSHAIPMIGVPKTIDNDLSGTEVTFGYDTACAVVSESVDALRATADAHRRIIVVETMGRESGWIALGGGLASYADAILIPERPFSRTKLVERVNQLKVAGRRGMMVVASEGAMAEGESAKVAFSVEGSPVAERLGGFAEQFARWIEKQTAWEARHVVLGHLQRSRPPTTTDRFLTLAMGMEVAEMVAGSDWGKAVVYRKGMVTRAPITDIMQPPRLVSRDHRWVKWAEKMGVFI